MRSADNKQPLSKASLLFLCFALLGGTLGQLVNINGEIGSEIVLTPLRTSKIEIVWKKWNNKVADWEAGRSVRIFPAYIERFKLDMTSGKLTITKLMEEDKGLYTVDVLIDREYETETFDLKVFPPLTEPLVTCRQEDGFAILTCNETSDAAVEYKWKGSSGELIMTPGIYKLLDNNKTLSVSLEKEHPEELVCVVQSPASERSKSITFSTCLLKREANNVNVGLIVSIVLIVLLGGGVSAFLYFKGFFNRCRKDCTKKSDDANPKPAVYRGINESDNVDATIPLIEKNDSGKMPDQLKNPSTHATDTSADHKVNNQHGTETDTHVVTLPGVPANDLVASEEDIVTEDASETATKVSHEGITVPEVETYAGAATKNQTNSSTSLEEDRDALSDSMHESKNKESLETGSSRAEQ